MFVLYHSCLRNFKKIKDQLLFYQTNVKISHYFDIKLYIKNQFIDRIVNKIQFEQNLICMLRTWEIWNSTIKILNLIPKNKSHEKFEEFHWQQKSQCVNGTLHVILIGTKEKAPTTDNEATKNIVAFYIVLLLLVCFLCYEFSGCKNKIY